MKNLFLQNTYFQYNMSSMNQWTIKTKIVDTYIVKYIKYVVYIKMLLLSYLS